MDITRASGPDLRRGGPFALDFDGEVAARDLLARTFGSSRLAMCVTDPALADNPIVYVNRAFEDLTGYRSEMVVGRNCRFLQGESTDPDALRQLRSAIGEHRTCIVELRNYRRDGSPFVNALHVGPIFDTEGRLRYFFGSQWDVSDVYASSAPARSPKARGGGDELNRRIDNLFTVIRSIVSTSAKGSAPNGYAVTMARSRIAAIGRAHDRDPADRDHGVGAQLGTLVETILSPFREWASVPVEAGGDPVELQMAAITPLGLVLHELAANSARHGSLGGHGRGLFFDWQRMLHPADRLRLVWRDEAEAIGGVVEERGGSRIIRAMARSFGGEYHARFAAGAYEAVIELPIDSVVATPSIKPPRSIAQDRARP